MPRKSQNILWVLLSGLMLSSRICPIFQVSNVTGTGLDFVCIAGQTVLQLCLTSRPLQVRTFLNLLPASEGDAERFDATQPLEVYFLLLTAFNSSTR